ncbi:MAG: sensor histidine kinase [Clostridia bacterium]|nr:sensor histidine kinase [Clostridia bacterium]
MLIFVFSQSLSVFIMNNRKLDEAKTAERKLEADRLALMVGQVLDVTRIDVSLDLQPVYAYMVRITQVLVNLIANALRHTYEGVITISASQKEGYMEVSVQDTGLGIKEQELENLFICFKTGARKIICKN